MRPRPVRSKSISALYVIAGSISLGLGVLGMFLPLLPTTPLWLLAAACYARGSQRFHHWLIHHPMFGETIRRYQSGEGIPRRARNKTLIILLGNPSVFRLVGSAQTVVMDPSGCSGGGCHILSHAASTG